MHQRHHLDPLVALGTAQSPHHFPSRTRGPIHAPRAAPASSPKTPGRVLSPFAHSRTSLAPLPEHLPLGHQRDRGWAPAQGSRSHSHCSPPETGAVTKFKA